MNGGFGEPRHSILKRSEGQVRAGRVECMFEPAAQLTFLVSTAYAHRPDNLWGVIGTAYGGLHNPLDRPQSGRWSFASPLSSPANLHLERGDSEPPRYPNLTDRDQ